MPWRRRTFTELPALSVRRQQLRRSLRVVTGGYALAMVWMTCVSGSHVKVFCRMLGFTNWHFGLMTALPYLATFAQLAAAVLVERSGMRKYQFLVCGTLHRLIWVAVAMIPLLLPIPAEVAIAAMLVLLCTSSFLAHLASPAWLNWMGDLIPRRIRGRYMASRSRIGSVVRIVVVIAIGIALDQVGRRGVPETAAAQPALLWLTCLVIAIGGVAGVFDILLFRTVREIIPPRRDADDRPPVFYEVPKPSRTFRGRLGYPFRYVGSMISQLLWDPLSDRVFRHYVCYGATITFTTAVGGWYFWLFGLEVLGFSKLGMNVLFMVVAPLCGIATVRMWGRLMDRWGRRPVLIFATAGTLLSVAPWFFATATTPAPALLAETLNGVAHWAGTLLGQGGWVWVRPGTPVGAYLLGMTAAGIGGVCWTGVALAQTGIILGFSDGQGRSKYVAASAALISLGGLVGGLVGGSVTQALAYLQHSPIRVGPLLWTNYHAAFALSLMGRALALLWLIRMPDPGATPVRYVVRLMGANVYNVVVPRLFYPLRLVGLRRRDWRRRVNGGGAQGPTDQAQGPRDEA